MGKPRPRREKWFFTQGHRKIQDRVRAGSQFSLAVHSLGGQQVLVSMAGVTWGVLCPSLTCFSPPSNMPWLTSEPLLLPFADKAAKASRGTWGQGVASGKSRLGDELERDQDSCLLSPSPGLSTCSYVGGSSHSGICQMGRDAKGFPQILSERAFLEGIKTGKEVARALTSEHSRY